MRILFYKYHGAGNDFIILNNRKSSFKVQQDIIKRLCDRRFGVGADGLMLLENSDKADFNMRYFNADGRESTMCGNGGRCIVAFARSEGLIDRETEFMAHDGLHRAIYESDTTIALEMQDVTGVEKRANYYIIDTGSPHYVEFVEDLESISVYEKGRKIRYDKSLSESGLNVNFVKLEAENRFSMRTYERGVENETLACGTGAVASAIATALEIQTDKFSFEVQAPGGILKVHFKHGGGNLFENVWLTGPAVFVFKGEIDI